MSDISEIENFLILLELNPTRIPTVQEYKKAFREKLKLHPDLGGDTAEFQEITEAARAVFEYITNHQKEQKRAESDGDKDLMRAFEHSNNVTYNKGSIVFDIDIDSSALD